MTAAQEEVSMYKRVLVTLDGSEVSEAVLTEVEKLAVGAGVAVTLFSVAEVPGATSEMPEPARGAGLLAPGVTTEGLPGKVYEDRGQAIQRARDEVGQYLASRAEKLRSKGVEVDTAVGFGDPTEEILETARARGADLIAMATHGRTGLSSVLFGSVASRVVGSGALPVLLVRPAALK
jgi:nucleotide-binding universal stress UspA family protein